MDISSAFSGLKNNPSKNLAKLKRRLTSEHFIPQHKTLNNHSCGIIRPKKSEFNILKYVKDYCEGGRADNAIIG
jgi:hypothetical protein